MEEPNSMRIRWTLQQMESNEKIKNNEKKQRQKETVRGSLVTKSDCSSSGGTKFVQEGGRKGGCDNVCKNKKYIQ